ncbi:MAG: AarF/UbiB family protein [Chloroflexota bacterium]|nr:AarF/UbiB family protein [Chloroflexota bacterium]
MRIGNTTLSPVAFYSQAVWDISYAYRVILVAWRLVEMGFISIRFLLVRAPILLIWTRLPATRKITLPGPYRDLQPILTPEREAKMGVAGGRLGSMPFLDAYKSPEDIKREQDFLKTIVKPPSPLKVIVGSVIRGLVTELGSVFIKFSQIISMRPELPPFVREELAQVQDKLPGLPPKDVKSILEKELMQPVENVFENVDYNYIAAGSLAVVHHAKLRDGRDVALKIQRPFLEGSVALDTIIILDVILGAAKLLLPRIRKTDLTFFTLSFESALKREINFELEGHVQEISRKAMQVSQQTADYMVIAEVYFEYTTTKLLAMEFVHGLTRIDDIFSLPAEDIWELLTMKIPGFDDDLPAHVLVMACRFPMHMSWQGEVFHGDLHMGNWYLTRYPDGAHPRIFLCDFGMHEDVPREGFRNVMFLLWGILAGFPDMAVDGMKSLHLESGGHLDDVDWDHIGMAFGNFSRSWIEDAPDEEALVRLRRSRLHEGGLTRQLLKLLFGEVVGSGLHLPYWLWLLLKSYLYEEEAGLSVMGGSYDWLAWIFDQYSVRIEKDAVLALFDRTNVFTMNRALDQLQFPLARGKDYHKVLTQLRVLQDEIKNVPGQTTPAIR